MTSDGQSESIADSCRFLDFCMSRLVERSRLGRETNSRTEDSYFIRFVGLNLVFNSLRN